jgi:hypothetical protein
MDRQNFVDGQELILLTNGHSERIRKRMATGTSIEQVDLLWGFSWKHGCIHIGPTSEKIARRKAAACS